MMERVVDVVSERTSYKTPSKLDDDQEGEGERIGDVAKSVELSVSDIIRTFDESASLGLGRVSH